MSSTWTLRIGGLSSEVVLTDWVFVQLKKLVKAYVVLDLKMLPLKTEAPVQDTMDREQPVSYKSLFAELVVPSGVEQELIYLVRAIIVAQLRRLNSSVDETSISIVRARKTTPP